MPRIMISLRMDRKEEIQALDEALKSGDFSWGELMVNRDADHVAIEGPRCTSLPDSAPVDVDEFRDWLRHSEQGVYRPLSGAKSMRGNWQLQGLAVSEAIEYLDAVYPLAWRHRCQYRAGELCVNPCEEVLRRQTGRYKRAAQLSEVGRHGCVLALCAQCVRVPCWNEAPTGIQGEFIPCPEPCNLFVTLASEALDWTQNSLPVCETNEAEGVGFAEFKHPGNPIRNRYLRQQSQRSICS